MTVNELIEMLLKMVAVDEDDGNALLYSNATGEPIKASDIEIEYTFVGDIPKATKIKF